MTKTKRGIMTAADVAFVERAAMFYVNNTEYNEDEIIEKISEITNIQPTRIADVISDLSF